MGAAVVVEQGEVNAGRVYIYIYTTLFMGASLRDADCDFANRCSMYDGRSESQSVSQSVGGQSPAVR